MLNKIYKYFFYFIFFFAFSVICLLIFNSNIRHKTLNLALNGYKVYMIVSIQTEIKGAEPDYENINKKLLNFIKISKKISSGESKLLIGIYDATNLVQSSIVEFNDFGKLEKSLFELSKLDPNLYEAKVWYASSLYANNKIDLAIQQLKEAIKISSLDADAYRLILKIFSQNSNNINFDTFCKDYLNTEFGGKQKRYQATKFSGFNINKFALKFNSFNDASNNVYIHDGININMNNDYEIIPEKAVDINSIDLIFTISPGTSLEINKLKLFSRNETFEIEEKDLIITSNNAFFINETNLKKILFTSANNQIINLNPKNFYKNIDKIIISLKLQKLDLSNKNCL